MNDARILIVDDDATICQYCAEALDAAGFAASTTTDARHALQLVSEKPFDLILTDIHMPEMDGLELARVIAERLPELVAIFITGFATLETVSKAARQGTYSFLEKPFSPDELVRAVRQALDRRQRLHDQIRHKSLNNLFQLAEKVTVVNDADMLFSLFIEAAVDQTGADSGELYMLDEEPPQEVPAKDDFFNSKGTTGNTGFSPGKILSQKVSAHNVAAARARLTGGDTGLLPKRLAVPVRNKGQLKGMLSLMKEVGAEFSQADREIAAILAAQAAVSMENSTLRNQAEKFSLETITSMAAMQEERDPYTAGHSLRVAKIASRLGGVIGLSMEEVANLELAGKLHDIGKIGIADHILMKPARLTTEEFDIIKTHVERGCKILRHVERLQMVIDAVATHHEWYDGRGYPRGLRGAAIPLSGAILGVADAFDAIVTDRPYRKRRSVKEALAIIEHGAGSQFHPQAVDAMRDAYKTDEK